MDRLLRAGLMAPILVWAGCGAEDRTPASVANATARSKGALGQRLAGLTAGFLKSASPETVAAVGKDIQTIRQSGIVKQAVAVGQKAPLFELPNATGKTVRLADLLREGPVVVAWYRGHWCPYCNEELLALQAALGDIRELGATLVAISPQLPDSSLSTVQKDNLKFEVLSDVGNRTARQYGLVYRVTAGMLAYYGDGVDFQRHNGDLSHELPLPATYVVDTKGVVQYAFVDPDYRNRAEPADLLVVLEKLRTR
jgi:peroxiredoxin